MSVGAELASATDKTRRDKIFRASAISHANKKKGEGIHKIHTFRELFLNETLLRI